MTRPALLLLALAGCGPVAPPTQPAAVAQREGTQVAEPAAKPVPPTTPLDLAAVRKDYAANPVAADAKYIGTRVRVSGYVDEIKANEVDIRGDADAKIQIDRTTAGRLQKNTRQTFDGTFAGYDPSNMFTPLRLTDGRIAE